MGKAQRDKGARGEREFVNACKAAGFAAERQAPMQTSNGTAHPDVLLEVGDLAFAVECKTGRSIRWFAAVDQALASTAHGQIPAVRVHRTMSKGEPPRKLVVLLEADFLDLCRYAAQVTA